MRENALLNVLSRKCITVYLALILSHGHRRQAQGETRPVGGGRPPFDDKPKKNLPLQAKKIPPPAKPIVVPIRGDSSSYQSARPHAHQKSSGIRVLAIRQGPAKRPSMVATAVCCYGLHDRANSGPWSNVCRMELCFRVTLVGRSKVWGERVHVEFVVGGRKPARTSSILRWIATRGEYSSEPGGQLGAPRPSGSGASTAKRVDRHQLCPRGLEGHRLLGIKYKV